ncbi:MAG: group 1 truncated hemoglobin [Candidatus Thiodiazotropha sp. (ex Lucinoma borealis)]|nr:group 1 truncated hemoglobin [Candidatus Thiodiazotropha sp. (ex Lucinoma borealis)]MCU7864853.1 group 1 truncated hemoglobin [Candidatus Thiodiazotropha sp. (ex Lucinoma borealis)]MCU7868488.1 group 1 truncated hemoglobin [Candidatus Thiodiazotropha sp. (ex Lucinoma borealis)]MCU7871711.1 group 1 truncated hemoglobin [Candidatus Thiodiazotropha sp. (ex Lucinoma borealis)]
MSETNTTLYERLGGQNGIAAIVEDIWNNHVSNPAIKQRYAGSDPENVKRLVREFFGAGIGGPETYTGQDMLTAHKGMNISDKEFVAVVDDVLGALHNNSVGQQEKDEVLCILYSMKGDIVHV